MKTKTKTEQLKELMEKVEKLSNELEWKNHWKEEESKAKFIGRQIFALMLECKPKNTIHDPQRIAEHLHLSIEDVYEALDDLRVKGRVHHVSGGYCLWQGNFDQFPRR